MTILVLWFSGSTGFAQKPAALTKLPLYELPATDNKHSLVLYISGDGGWNDFSQKLTASIAASGYPVVILDARKYFWNQRTPSGFTNDIEQILSYYLKLWGRSRFAVIGYSFGADVAPFLTSRLNAENKKLLSSMVLLSPSSSTDFIVRISDLLGNGSEEGRKYPVLPELETTSVPTVCIFGDQEKIKLKSNLKENSLLKKRDLPGSHRYNNDIKAVSAMCLGYLN